MPDKLTPHCSNCLKLRECAIITQKRLLADEPCGQWQVAKPATLHARKEIIKIFGLWALQFEVHKLQQKVPGRKGVNDHDRDQEVHS